MYDLAVIVPIYRTMAYIGECVDSIMQCISSRVALILVDDGCPDNTLENYMCLHPELQEREGVYVVKQSNMGLSAARNAGIELAIRINSKYCAFVDSDDVVLPGYFNEIFRAMDEFEFDILEFEMARFHDATELNMVPTDIVAVSYFGPVKEVRQKCYIDSRWHCCRRVFRTSFFRQYRFDEGFLFEDMLLCSRVYMSDFNLLISNAVIYGYRVNNQGITRSPLTFEKKQRCRESFSLCLERLEIMKLPEFFGCHVAFTAANFGLELNTRKVWLKPKIISQIVKYKKGSLRLKMLFFCCLPTIYIKVLSFLKGYRE